MINLCAQSRVIPASAVMDAVLPSCEVLTFFKAMGSSNSSLNSDRLFHNLNSFLKQKWSHSTYKNYFKSFPISMMKNEGMEFRVP